MLNTGSRNRVNKIIQPYWFMLNTGSRNRVNKIIQPYWFMLNTGSRNRVNKIIQPYWFMLNVGLRNRVNKIIQPSWFMLNAGSRNRVNKIIQLQMRQETSAYHSTDPNKCHLLGRNDVLRVPAASINRVNDGGSSSPLQCRCNSTAPPPGQRCISLET